MATTTQDARLVLLWVATTNSFAAAKAIVCESDSSFDGTRDVTTEDTKCELLKSLGSQNNKISGNGVLKLNPTATQISFQQLMTYYSDGQLLYAWYTDAGTDGGDVFASGQGWFTQIGSQNTSGQFSKFSYTFEFNGDVDVTAS